MAVQLIGWSLIALEYRGLWFEYNQSTNIFYQLDAQIMAMLFNE